jgi:hypothetical protein
MWVASGRNGKGALERVIESILGEFAVHLRWSDIAEQPMGAENTLKRTAVQVDGSGGLPLLKSPERRPGGEKVRLAV